MLKYGSLNSLIREMPEDRKCYYDQLIDNCIGDLSIIGMDIDIGSRNSDKFKRKSEEELIKIKTEIKKMYIVSLKLEKEMIAYISTSLIFISAQTRPLNTFISVSYTHLTLPTNREV